LQSVEMRERLVRDELDHLRRTANQRLEGGILAVEDSQGIGGESPARIVVEIRLVLREIGDERVAMVEALVQVAERIDLERDAAGEPQLLPQPREHDDLLRVDVGSLEAERFDIELMKLPVAALLRA